MTAQTTSSSVSTTTSLSEKLSTSNSSVVSNSEWHFEAIVTQNESGIVVQSNLTSIVNRTRTAIFGDPTVIVVIRQLNGTVVYSPVITALARIVNVSFGQSFLSTQQIQVALQAHEAYNFVITPQVGDNSTSGAPGVSIEFTPLFSETTATASNLNPVTSSTINPTLTSSLEETTTTNVAFTNMFFTSSCSISGIGGFEFRLVSDSTGQPVNADSISAVDKLGCNNENQVVYLDNFSYFGDGWFTPMFPSRATVGGGLNIAATYDGKTYNFAGYYQPVGTDCVTLSVPSGNVSSTTVMNGNGSYCSQTATTSITSSTSFSASCSTSYFNGTDVVSTMFLNQMTGSSVNLCVRFFYYNSTTTIILPLRQLTLYSVVPSNGTLANTHSLFSISATTSEFQIGGPQSENEGFEVNYTISATSSTPSATYEIGLSSGLYPNYVICGYGIYVDLQVGNTTNPTVGTSCHYVPAPIDNLGLVYTEIIGKTNSTA